MLRRSKGLKFNKIVCTSAMFFLSLVFLFIIKLRFPENKYSAQGLYLMRAGQYSKPRVTTSHEYCETNSPSKPTRLNIVIAIVSESTHSYTVTARDKPKMVYLTENEAYQFIRIATAG